MILGYKKKFPWGTETNFKRKILDGKKEHTIREDVHDRWHAGRKIQHAHGVRTKQYDNFLDGYCKSVQPIQIFRSTGASMNYSYTGKFFNRIDKKDKTLYEDQFQVVVNYRVLNFLEIDKLAANDGFDSTNDFFRWFYDGFEGKIIHFTDLKY